MEDGAPDPPLRGLIRPTGLDFIEPRAEITAEIAPGDVVEVEQHDGTTLRLRKLDASA